MSMGKKLNIRTRFPYPKFIKYNLIYDQSRSSLQKKPCKFYVKALCQLMSQGDTVIAHLTNQRPVSRSRDHSRPMRGRWRRHNLQIHSGSNISLWRQFWRYWSEWADQSEDRTLTNERPIQTSVLCGGVRQGFVALATLISTSLFMVRCWCLVFYWELERSI